MLIVKNLSKHIAGDTLFEKVSFVMQRGEKVGLVGPNGSGKSTILRIIAGEVESDGGTVVVQGERVGYLPQQATGSVALPLSGGEKTKAALGQIFAANPTLLLLDEPSNHLDADGSKALERFLKDFRGGVLLVSHDRRLLDGVCHRILEIDSANGAFSEYRGGYTDYLREKQCRSDLQEEAYDRQRQEKKRLELWLTLKRQEARLHADPAKGKQIRAMEKRIQREIYDQQIIRPSSQKKIKSLSLLGETANPKLIIRAQNLTNRLGTKTIFSNVSFELRGRERVRLAGANGSGKTTLLKILTGALRADSGEFQVGEGVRIGYFAQEHETLSPNKTVMQEFLSTERPMYSSKDARALLGAFLFSDAAVFKKVGDLSLGERVRLMFAKLTHQENELLILDEPTNHLDIQSREIIERALTEYQGAILVVSHDRYFLDKLGINRVLTITNGNLKEDLRR